MSRGPSVLFEFLHVTNRHVVAKEHKKKSQGWLLKVFEVNFLIINLNLIFKSKILDFAEHLKLLGYQENIPLAILSTFSGKETSFRAYANILVWLIKNLDPDAMIHQDSHTESDRVMLIRTSTEFLVIKKFEN